MFFDDLTPEEIALVEEIGVVREYAEGQYLIQEGVPGCSFFMIVSGRVEVQKSLGPGKYKRLVELGSCDLIGEVCFLGVVFRSASVLALSDVKAIEFERETFDRLVEQYPVVGMKVYRGMARELAQRLSRTDDEVRDTILWALTEARTYRSQLKIAAAKAQSAKEVKRQLHRPPEPPRNSIL